MNIIIVGGGKIGTSLLQSFSEEGHDIVMIDSNPHAISEISNTYDVMCVCGNGVDWETLTEAGAQKAHLLVAVTGSDEFNMLCCLMAGRVGTQYTVARIRKPEYNDQSLDFIRQQLDLTMSINPDALAARELFHLLQLPGAANVETFSRGKFELVEIVLKPDSILDGMSLQEMKQRYQAQYLVGTVHREGQAIIPSGSFVLKAGDRIGLTGTAREIERLLKLLGMSQERARNVMLIGGSRSAFYLSKMLLEAGAKVTVIDRDPAICDSFAEALPDALVVCGDAAKEELLLEEGLDNADAFVTLTGMDEQNILLSYLAEAHGVKKVITKINREEFVSLAQTLKLDSVITPKNLVKDVMIRLVRALDNSMGSSSMETLYNLMDGKAEALEFKVSQDFSALGIPLKNLKLRQNTLIAGILRGRQVMIPSGNDEICAGDRVIVLTANSGLSDLSDFLE